MYEERRRSGGEKEREAVAQEEERTTASEREGEKEAEEERSVPNIAQHCVHPFVADEEAMEKLFAALDRCEAILSDRRYLCGARLTEADIRLFVTLIRFDEVYTVHFKTNRRMIREYPNLLNYTRELYQLPAITGTVHFDHIKHHYYRSHPGLNPLGLVPVGFPLDWTAPHGRERLS